MALFSPGWKKRERERERERARDNRAVLAHSSTPTAMTPQVVERV
jgi:hypothetical protein